MSVLLRAAGLFGLGPRKTRTEIACEIADELAFHLESRARELEGQGLAPEEASARAKELFGDVERTARECARIQMGGRIMLVRIQWVVIAVLVVALALVGWRQTVTRAMLLEREHALRAEAEHDRARLQEMEQVKEAVLAMSRGERLAVGEGYVPPTSSDELAARWLAELVERPEDWRHAVGIYEELLALPPDEALAALTDLWPQLSVTQKQQALKAFAFEHGHARILAVLHLGATDAALEVQAWAFQYLREYSFRNFAEDYDAYLAWAATWGGRPLDQVLAENARAFLQELWGRSPAEVEQRLRDFEDLDFRSAAKLGLDLSQVFRDAGALAMLEGWLRSPELRAEDSGLNKLAFSWAKTLAPDEAWLCAHVLPFLDDADESLAGPAARALGDPRNAWAVPELLARLERTVPGSDASNPNSADWAAASALAEIGDPSVIPALIGLIASNPGYNTVYGIGYFALGKLTGVTYDESHDGNWWIDWWGKNQGRFPPEVRALPIPGF